MIFLVVVMGIAIEAIVRDVSARAENETNLIKFC